MKKNVYKKSALIAVVIVTLGLTGCCMQHDWADATCTEPQTCTKCGETQGEALGHQWTDATCTEPKTCSVCGETEGEALGHQWVEATFEAPQTCSVCGTTVGEKYDITVTETACDNDMYIENAREYIESALQSEMEDTARSFTADYFSDDGDPENIEVEFSEPETNVIYGKDYVYVIAGNGFTGLDYNVLQYISSGFYEICCLNYDGEVQSGIVLSCGAGYRGVDSDDGFHLACFNSNSGEIAVYDNKLSEIASATVENSENMTMEVNSSDPANPVIYLYDGTDTIYYDLDLNEVDGSSMDEAIAAISSLENSGNWAYVSYCGDDVYYVGNADDWGYVDKDGNELAMYVDATEFAPDGYAFVSADGENYSIINKDLETVKENAIEANSASYACDNTFNMSGNSGNTAVTITITGGPGETEE